MHLFRRKWILITVLVLSVPVLLLILEHFRGRWSLSHWKRQMAERGEKFSIPDLYPTRPLGVESHFQELMVALGRSKGSHPSLISPPALRYVAPGRVLPVRYLDRWPHPEPGSWRQERNRDGRLELQTESNLTWEVVAEAMESWSNAVSEVKALLHDTALDPQLDYVQGFALPLPHLTPLKGLGRDLNAAALWELRRGNRAAALDHIKDTLAVVRLLAEERFIICQLVGQFLASAAVGATWQALQQPGWTDDQWADLQACWQSAEFLEPMVRALEMERAVVVQTLAQARTSVDYATQVVNLGNGFGGGTPGPASGSLSDVFDFVTEHSNEIVARGLYIPLWQFAWSFQDELHYLKGSQLAIDAGRSAARDQTSQSLTALAAPLEEWSHADGFLDRFRHQMSSLLAGSMDNALEKAVAAQSQRELVVAAIALERYRLQHGRFPSTLEPLVPRFLPALPRDYWSGGPLQYRFVEGQPPLLYAVGKDRKDDGGDPSPASGDKSMRNLSPLSSRDAVWPAACSQEEAAAALEAARRDPRGWSNR